MSEEKSLADTENAVVVDVTEKQDPATFDLDGWIAGVRPNRRAVQLNAAGHLVAELERIAEQIDSAPEDENVDGLIDEFDRVKKQIQDGVWFVIEQRSADWINEFHEQHKKEEVSEMALRQLSAQIIEPAGVTYDHLRALERQNNVELAKLMAAMREANQHTSAASGVLMLDFSRRRSAATRM